MKFKKYILLISALSGLFILLFYLNHSKNNQPEFNNQDSRIIIENEYLLSDIKSPSLKETADLLIAQKIKNFQNLIGNDFLDKNDFQLSISIQKGSFKDIENLVFFFDEYTGGLNYSLGIETLSFNLQNEKKVTLKEILGEDEFQKMKAEVKDEIIFREIEISDTLEIRLNENITYENYLLGPNSIIVFFAPYTINDEFLDIKIPLN